MDSVSGNGTADGDRRLHDGWIDSSDSDDSNAQRVGVLALDRGSTVADELAGTPLARDRDRWRKRFAREIVARKRAEREIAVQKQRLGSLAQQLRSVEERERLRLSMDLHDGLSQTIALVKLKLGALRRSKDPSLRKSVLQIEELIDEANRSARSITFELCPHVLHDLGLEAALEELALSVGARYGVKIVLVDDGRAKSIDTHTRAILFRSIRELLINAAKHARAVLIRVHLERGEQTILATVDDDGVGMRSDVARPDGCGLYGIRERLGHLGGSMSIESAPGRGTRICLSAPLSPESRVDQRRAHGRADPASR